MAKKIATSKLSRRVTRLSCCILLMAAASTAAGQQAAEKQAVSAATYWKRFGLGFAGSVLAHESAHILASFALGAHPHIGLDKGRPTIFSGIDSQKDPRKQFVFSAAGLTMQDLINEAILDIPHSKGSPLERGILAGGIGTTLFYITLGRNGAVSDVAFMSRTSSLSRNQVSLIFGGISAFQAWRVSRDPRYNHFFIRPVDNGFALGLTF